MFGLDRRSFILDHIYVKDPTVMSNLTFTEPFFGDHVMVELIINANKIVKEPIRRRDWHNYFINFLEGLIPRVSEAHCEYTS